MRSPKWCFIAQQWFWKVMAVNGRKRVFIPIRRQTLFNYFACPSRPLDVWSKCSALCHVCGCFCWKLVGAPRYSYWNVLPHPALHLWVCPQTFGTAFSLTFLDGRLFSISWHFAVPPLELQPEIQDLPHANNHHYLLKLWCWSETPSWKLFVCSMHGRSNVFSKSMEYVLN